MEVVANNYLPGDQRLVEKIVYELKAQGIFDQFRKECFADVDTKPAYQNLRQRVEGSVSGFLKEQSWRPDMNKNQVREMLRKKITESGYLETGVERIVDQVVNPKINTVFLPKVEEIVYNYLGIKKPNRNEGNDCDLLPTDLEAVSPESEPTDKKDDKSSDNLQDLEENKTEEDESPPFEPLEEQTSYMPQEENSVDSHLSGFSGLASHESNSNEIKPAVVEQDSQMSRNSSDSRLSIVTSDENTKMEICEDFLSKSVKSNDSGKHDDKKPKASEKHRSRSDKDRRSTKDSKSGHSSSKDKDRKDSKSSKHDKEKDSKEKEKERKSSSSSKHSSHSSKDKDKKDSKSEKDKDRTHSSHKDSKSKSADKDSKSRSDKDRHRHSSTSSSDKHKKEKDTKDKKKEKSKDDHYSSKDKKNDRRSTDRDSSDGQSGKHSSSHKSESNGVEGQKSQESSSSGGDSGNSSQSDNTTKAAQNMEQKVKVLKPKCASNIQEALRLRKIRKQLAKLEKQNQLSLTSVDVNSSILMSASISIDDLKTKDATEEVNTGFVPSPLQNTVISQDNWDAMEAKLREEVVSEFKQTDDSLDESVEEVKEEEDCKYFDEVDLDKIEFLVIVKELLRKYESVIETQNNMTRKRKIDIDVKNNNNKIVPEKKTKVVKKKEKVNNHVEKFPLPLSPAESDKSSDKKEEAPTPLRVKRNTINKMNNQRYSSDDLYKPRPTFASSRRRGAKNLDN